MNTTETFSFMSLECWKAVCYKTNTKALTKREETFCLPYPGCIGQYADKLGSVNKNWNSFTEVQSLCHFECFETGLFRMGAGKAPHAFLKEIA